MFTAEETGRRIRTLRKAKKMSQTALADAAGYSNKTSICKAELGATVIPANKLKRIAAALGTNVEYLCGDDSKAAVNLFVCKMQKIPVVDGLGSGEYRFSGFSNTATEVKADYAVRVQSNSMATRRIFKGDIVFIHAVSSGFTPNPEAVYAIVRDGVCELCTIDQRDDVIAIWSGDPLEKPESYYGDREPPHVIGKVVAFISKTM